MKGGKAAGSSGMNRGARKRQRKAERRGGGRQVRRRSYFWLMPVGVAAGLVLLGGLLVAAYGSVGSAPKCDYTTTFPPVDGIQCGVTEQLAYHIHVHLAIYDNGQAEQVPYGIGIESPQPPDDPDNPYISSGACFYWLHTHDDTGIIHIESPKQKTYDLGNFFDVWGQPLGGYQAGDHHGLVIAYVNGEQYTGDPRQIPLTAHEVIQL